MRVLLSLLFSAWLLGAQPLAEGSRNNTPITPAERLRWVTVSTIGPSSLIGGVFSAGYGTLINSPSEYGPHWQGFGQRYGMRLTGVATSNVVEAGAGAMWGEDPRYPRASEGAFGRRLGHAVRMTFLAPNENGHVRPAYARYLGITSNNFLSNTWRADSEATGRDASVRVVIGFVGRMGSNVFTEFWPDVSHRLFRTKKHSKR